MRVLGLFLFSCWIAFLLAGGSHPAFAQESSIEARLEALEAQNNVLLQQLSKQQMLIENLQKQLHSPDSTSVSPATPGPAADGGLMIGRVRLNGAGGVGFFHTKSDGLYENSPFRVDEAKLFLEAPLGWDTYFFSELNVASRETDDEFFQLGEFYVDFENLSRFFGRDNLLSLRFGRLDIPFGEEYLVRDVVDNPLISHSLSDIWGVDEGVEIYGRVGPVDYILAVQNGGHPTLNDYDADKSVAGRLGYQLGSRGRLSLSGMRTGTLSVAGDGLSEVWFGNGFFRPIGPPARTTSFKGNLFELDGQAFWDSGHLKTAAGYFIYDDDDFAAENSREGTYYYAEAVQRFRRKWHGALRFSHILTDDGFPIVGHGRFGRYLFGPLTSDIWRLSLGVGYQWNEHLLVKTEYSLENRDLSNGENRSHDFLGAEIGFRF